VREIEKEMIKISDAGALRILHVTFIVNSFPGYSRTRNLKIKEVRKIEYEAENSELTALREEAKCYKDQF
jgi:hypothetical protein